MTDPHPSDDALLARCRRIGTSTWSDALDTLDLDGVIDGLTVRAGGDAPVAGFAVTAKERVHGHDRADTTGFDIGGILAAVRPQTMLAIDVGGACVSTVGGLAAMAAERAGAVGVLIDGACRDLAEITGVRLWVATRHLTARSGKGRIQVEGIDVPVTIGGVTVAPGDLLVGDATGAVCIPRARLDEVLPVAEDLAQRDARFTVLLHTKSFAAAAWEIGPV